MAINWEHFPLDNNWNIQYTIWLKKDSDSFEIIVDENWNILTNVRWFIIDKVESIFWNHWNITTIQINNEIFELLNNLVWRETQESKKKVNSILNLILNNEEKTA